MARHCVGAVEEFLPDQVRVLRLDGERVGLVVHEDKFYAWEDRCTHDDAPIGEGILRDCQIECPRHGARFDVRSGRVTCPPAFTPLEIYEAEVEQGQVYVTLPD